MGTVFHLLGEDVAGITFASDMDNLDNFVLDPFANFRIAKFKMADPFRGEVTRPVDHSFVIIVEHGGAINVEKRDSDFDESFGQIANTNSEFAALVSRPNFGFARTHGSFLLADTFPS